MIFLEYSLKKVFGSTSFTFQWFRQIDIFFFRPNKLKINSGEIAIWGSVNSSPPPSILSLKKLDFLLENHSHSKFLLDSAHCRLGKKKKYKFALDNGNLQRGISCVGFTRRAMTDYYANIKLPIVNEPFILKAPQTLHRLQRSPPLPLKCSQLFWPFFATWCYSIVENNLCPPLRWQCLEMQKVITELDCSQGAGSDTLVPASEKCYSIFKWP